MTPALRSILLSLAAAGSIALAGCAKQSDAVPAVPIGTITGQQINAADFKGKVTLVNFWATDCVTCVKEMPMLVDTYTKFKPRGYETVAVAMKHDRPDFVLHFAETRKLPFKVALDPKGEVALAWNNTRVTPTSYLVNKRGEIVKRYVGEPELAEFHATIEKLLAES